MIVTCSATVMPGDSFLLMDDSAEQDVLRSELWTTLFRGGYMMGKLQRSLSGKFVSCPVIIILAFGPYWNIGRLQELSWHPDLGPVSQVLVTIIIIIIIIVIIIIAFGPHWSVGHLQEFSWHPDLGPVSQVLVTIIIIIIIIAFGPYWSIGRLQELSCHPDLGPVSQVFVTIIIIIIIITGLPFFRGFADFRENEVSKSAKKNNP